MISSAQARRMMVDGQIRTNDVTDLALLAAFLEVPRERFVPADKTELAYLDLDLPVLEAARGAPARRLLRALVLAKLIQAAAIEPQQVVLDVGCGTGYSAAVLARLAAHVVALEEEPALAAMASRTLAELEPAKVTVVTGPLTAGWPARSPYDVILLDGRTEIVPRSLFPQLKDGGRLVCIEGKGPAAKGMLYLSTGGDVGGRPIFDASAQLLPGFAEPPAFVF
jgi:protein-L-isoaspartate(D-aspartate) O-methyltransferase